MDRITQAVLLIARFGWLRAYELSLFLFPVISANAQSRRTMARRVVDELKQMKFVQATPLPGGSEALALSARGADFAREVSVATAHAVHMKSAPRDWRHDCYVAQMLYACAGAQPDCFVTEFEILASDGTDTERPDGLILRNGTWHLIEVENARKSGPHMRMQSQRVERAVLDGLDIAGREVEGAVLCYPLNVRGVNHRVRLINSLNQTELAGYEADELVLVGFEITSQTHAVAGLTRKHGGVPLSLLQVEMGLPAEIATGQARGQRRQYGCQDIEIIRELSVGSRPYFRLLNLQANFDMAPGGREVAATELMIGDSQISCRSYDFPPPLYEAVDQALAAINRLRRDEDGNFIPPRRCMH